MKLIVDPTPAGVLFDVLKRCGGITHRELATLILSGRPLADGRSPLDRAEDRTWVSHCIVHAPVGALQERYFCDYGTAAARVMGRLKARRGRAMGPAEVLDMLCGASGRAMDRALLACHQDAHLYRNSLARLAGERGYAPEERAQAALALFIAVACTTNVRAAVTYVTEFVQRSYGGRATTPLALELAEGCRPAGSTVPERVRALGLLRLEDGYVAGGPHWLQPEGCEVGALVMGEGDVTDVGPCVSGRHVRIWREGGEKDAGASAGSGVADCWLVEDLGSTNGTVLVSGSDATEAPLLPGHPAGLHASDQLILAGDTTFVVIEGLIDPLDP